MKNCIYICRKNNNMFGSMDARDAKIMCLVMIIIGIVLTAVSLCLKDNGSVIRRIFFAGGLYFLAIGIPVYLIVYFVDRNYK